MEQKRIKVRLTKNSPYPNYGYYEEGDIGYIDGYVNDNAVIILENGKFAKADLRWIEVVNEEDKNVNTELKESDDERIRKVLLDFFRNELKKRGDEEWDWGFHTTDVIAWVEKQGKNNMGISEATKQKLEDNLNKALEKETPESWNEFLDGQGEQKPADKVEPKFHEGEWLCENEPNNYARFIQILEIVNVQGKDRYRISRDIHKDEDIVEFNFVEKYYHKFDIKDANDGDVLYCKSSSIEYFVMIKGVNEHGNIDSYFRYNSLIGIDMPAVLSTRHNDITPATKEQREQLEKAMADAGYLWDAEKKELKKIDQKPAWSEEDETILKRVIDFIPQCMTAHGYNEYVNWLKSLKDRMQPKQEWSEKDKEMIGTIRTIIEKYAFSQSAVDVNGELCEKEYIEADNWLKSLRPQNRWKLSGEQIKALNEAIYHVDDSIATQIAMLIGDLKKLRVD